MRGPTSHKFATNLSWDTRIPLSTPLPPDGPKPNTSLDSPPVSAQDFATLEKTPIACGTYLEQVENLVELLSDGRGEPPLHPCLLLLMFHGASVVVVLSHDVRSIGCSLTHSAGESRCTRTEPVDQPFPPIGTSYHSDQGREQGRSQAGGFPQWRSCSDFDRHDLPGVPLRFSAFAYRANYPDFFLRNVKDRRSLRPSVMAS